MKKIIDLIELRNQIRNGTFTVFEKKNKIYIKDTENEECIMLCDLQELKAKEETLCT